jgi:hypothetical protein
MPSPSFSACDRDKSSEAFSLDDDFFRKGFIFIFELLEVDGDRFEFRSVYAIGNGAITPSSAPSKAGNGTEALVIEALEDPLLCLAPVLDDDLILEGRQSTGGGPMLYLAPLLLLSPAMADMV